MKDVQREVAGSSAAHAAQLATISEYLGDLRCTSSLDRRWSSLATITEAAPPGYAPIFDVNANHQQPFCCVTGRCGSGSTSESA
jgi:hypothetical protein